MAGNAIPVAYYYFDFNDREKQEVASFVRSVIAQLCTKLDHIPDSVQTLYKDYQLQQPNLRKLVDVLITLLNIGTNAYIVIDALDECSHRDSLLANILRILGSYIVVRLLVSSRREMDIKRKLGPLARWTIDLTNSAHHEDIRRYIQTQLEEDSELNSWSVAIRLEIEKSLVNGAQGMYALISC